MFYTNVELEVMKMRGVGIFFKKTYSVLAWNFPEACIKAAAKAESDGYSVVRVISVWE